MHGANVGPQSCDLSLVFLYGRSAVGKVGDHVLCKGDLKAKGVSDAFTGKGYEIEFREEM